MRASHSLQVRIRFHYVIKFLLLILIIFDVVEFLVIFQRIFLLHARGLCLFIFKVLVFIFDFFCFLLDNIILVRFPKLLDDYLGKIECLFTHLHSSYFSVNLEFGEIARILSFFLSFEFLFFSLSNVKKCRTFTAQNFPFQRLNDTYF